MRNPIGLLATMALVLLAAPRARGEVASGTVGVPAATRQLITVLAPDFNSPTAQLRRFEKIKGKWRPVGARVAVVVGRSGMGWGRGLFPGDRTMEGPQKKEGDGRAPAGIFELGEVTGYADKALAGSKLHYTPTTPQLRCVDDAKSDRYNRLTVGPANNRWDSDEPMRRDDALYTWTIFVEHNSGKPVKGAGSCIFLHVWLGPDKPTVGCTAMTLENLESLLKWLDPAAHPLLLQVPEANYPALARALKLPIKIAEPAP